MNRLIAIIYPDGTSKHFYRDAIGNIVRILDQNRNIIDQHFDPVNRLVDRSFKQTNKRKSVVERFKYDGLNRIVSAEANDITILRHYVSLSRLLEENQDGRIIRYGYDAPGNRTLVVYPTGKKIHKTYEGQVQRL